MNKLSTHNLCTSNWPGFTGCTLHATYKYLPSMISPRTNSQHSFWAPSLLPVPSSCLSRLLLPWQPKWINLGILSLTTGTCLLTSTFFVHSQTGPRLSFKFTIKWCWIWSLEARFWWNLVKDLRILKSFFEIFKGMMRTHDRARYRNAFLLTGASHLNSSFRRHIQGWWRFLA